MNPDWKDAVLHARISIGGTELMAADIPNAKPMRSAYLSLGMDSDNEAERVFSVLSDDGQIFMGNARDVLRLPLWAVTRSVRRERDDIARAP